MTEYVNNVLSGCSFRRLEICGKTKLFIRRNMTMYAAAFRMFLSAFHRFFRLMAEGAAGPRKWVGSSDVGVNVFLPTE